MTENKRFMLDDAGELIDLNNHSFIDYGEECCNLLNELNEENSKLYIQNDFLKDENQHMRDLVNENEQLKDDVYDWKASAEDYLKLGKSLKKENEQLKTKNFAYLQDIEVFKEENTHLKLKNEQLQERNNRQCRQLDKLYKLIEKQDWKTLTGLIQEFQECEEQLQKEWGTYGDVE